MFIIHTDIAFFLLVAFGVILEGKGILSKEI